MNKLTGYMSRRQILVLGGITTLGTLAACATEPEDEPSGQDRPPATTDDREAPMLTELVESGDLPPVDDRLPDNPMVVDPVEEPGVYGGQWRNVMNGVQPIQLTYGLSYENLVRWNLAFDEILPNVAEGFETSADGGAITFHLRAGMKWSDGELFGADDIVFAYESVALDEQIFPTVSASYVSGGKPGRVEKVDDQTVSFIFDPPHGLFLRSLASEPSNLLTRMPRHFLEEFHGGYNSDADAVAEEMGYEGWVQLMQAVSHHDGQWQEPELAVNLPSLLPWISQNALGDEDNLVLERNPYYWKTDSDGRQLPYLDSVRYEMVSDDEVQLLKTLNGEVDYLDSQATATNLENRPIFAANAESADYRFIDLVPSDKCNSMTIQLNLTSPDEVKREIFSNKDFRIGLSHALDRQEIIDVVFKGQAEPSQAAPVEGSEFYDEELAKQYTDYDVDLANSYLDQAGYAERNGDGVRLGPDGEPISFQVDAATDSKVELIDALELVRTHWREIGIDMRANPMANTLRTERSGGNQHDANVWDGPGGLDVIGRPFFYLPIGVNSDFGRPWVQWYTSDGSDGEEPPEETKRQLQLYDELKTTVDPERQAALMREILTITKEEFYTIGIATDVPQAHYGVAKNNFRNVPNKVPFAATLPPPGAFLPEQYFIQPE